MIIAGFLPLIPDIHRPVRAGEIGPDLFRAACSIGLEGLVSKRWNRPYPRRPLAALGEDQEPDVAGNDESAGYRVAEPSPKISFEKMRESGVRGLLIYCSDFRCSHRVRLSAEDCDRWPDDVRLSDIEPQFACRPCGKSPGRCQTGL